MKRLISLVLAVWIIVLTSICSSAYTISSTKVFSCSDYSGLYTVKLSGKQAQIIRYASAETSVLLTLSYTAEAACAFGGRIALFCDDSSNNQLAVYVYDIDRDTLDSFMIYGIRLYGNTDYCCDSDGIYIESHRDSSELYKYSYDGSRINTYSFMADITCLVNGYDSGIYVVAGGSLYHISGGSFTELSGAADPPLFPADADCLASAYGKVYSLDGNDSGYAFDVDTDYTAEGACVISNTLYYPCRSAIYGYNIYNGEKICSYDIGTSVKLLYAFGNTVIAVNPDSNISFYINRDDFTDLRKHDESPESILPDQSNSSGDTPEITHISSDVYDIDFERYYISGIEPSTTVAQFRNNIDFGGYSLSVYRGGDIKKSGSVGTAMTATFSNSGESLSFELSVKGDLTGEGNRNSRDINLLLDYLIGSADFNGVYELSADLSGDRRIDVVDAALLKR